MIMLGDVREKLAELPDESVQVCCTSPPYYGLRKYGDDPRQLGLEETPEQYVASMVEVFRAVRRVLRKDGLLWLNLGDSYAGSGKGPTGHNGIGNQGKRQGFTGNGGMHRSSREAGAIGNAWVPPPPGLKNKDLIGIPWAIAFALRADGWYLRQDVIWAKPNPMPESVGDRCTRSHEYIFMLSKSRTYYYDADAVKQAAVSSVQQQQQAWASAKKNHAYGEIGGTPINETSGGTPSNQRNRRSVWRVHTPRPGRRSIWRIPTQSYRGAHFATWPEKLVEPMILAGSRVGDTVLDPFAGSGTTWVVASRLGRRFVGIELNPGYVDLAHQRLVDAWTKTLKAVKLA